MAKDFPEAKYGYRATKDVRSFGEIIVHVSSGNAYAAKAGRGEKANWDEIDPKGYTTKAAMVALLEKTIADADATLKATPEDRWAKTVQPWLAVIEHAGEHYGQLWFITATTAWCLRNRVKTTLRNELPPASCSSAPAPGNTSAIDFHSASGWGRFPRRF